MTDERDEMDVEYEKALGYAQAALGMARVLASAVPGGDSVIRKHLDKLVPEIVAKTREIIFAKKLDAEQRLRAARLLARLPADIEAMVKPPEPNEEDERALAELENACGAFESEFGGVERFRAEVAASRKALDHVRERLARLRGLEK